MTSCLLYLPYLPNITWFNYFLTHEKIFIEREENFVKSSFRNRCEIAGANGKQTLSIPIIGGRDHNQLYKEVRIANREQWQKKHWQAIRSAYGSAPYFEFYADKLQPVYETEFEFLFDFNTEVLKTVLAILKVKKDFEFTSVYEKHPNEKKDLRNAEEKLSLLPVKYYQVFDERNGFIENLSAPDFIFNEGHKNFNRLFS